MKPPTAGSGAVRCVATLVAAATTVALAGCSEPTRPTAPAATATAPTRVTAPPVAARRLASEPVQLADDLVADEQVLRDPASSEDLLVAAAHRQQAAYRAIGWHPHWDAVTRPRVPPWLLAVYDRNVDARRQLTPIAGSAAADTLPAWRIEAPVPADELLGYYHEAEAATGVGWNYLAAINLIETGFGRVAGVSTAGAQGPMQFLPATFAEYGNGGDILSPHDSIMAAGHYLAANGFADDHDGALFRYNNWNRYVWAVDDYAAVLAADPAAFAGYYRWNVYYHTATGDVVLPIGYAAAEPIPVAEYMATHQQ